MHACLSAELHDYWLHKTKLALTRRTCAPPAHNHPAHNRHNTLTTHCTAQPILNLTALTWYASPRCNTTAKRSYTRGWSPAHALFSKARPSDSSWVMGEKGGLLSDFSSSCKQGGNKSAVNMHNNTCSVQCTCPSTERSVHRSY